MIRITDLLQSIEYLVGTVISGDIGQRDQHCLTQLSIGLTQQSGQLQRCFTQNLLGFQLCVSVKCCLNSVVVTGERSSLRGERAIVPKATTAVNLIVL
jgi:hypothetical protein